MNRLPRSHNDYLKGSRIYIHDIHTDNVEPEVQNKKKKETKLWYCVCEATAIQTPDKNPRHVLMKTFSRTDKVMYS